MIEETLIIVKPDGVKRGLIGEVIKRLEMKQMEIVDLKMSFMKKDEALMLYEMHRGKEFFEELIKFITSGPVVLVRVKGENAVLNCRIIVGETYPEKRTAGSIRGDFSSYITENIVHASSSKEDAKREIKLFFE